jgi:hypothetical protein
MVTDNRCIVQFINPIIICRSTRSARRPYHHHEWLLLRLKQHRVTNLLFYTVHRIADHDPLAPLPK